MDHGMNSKSSSSANSDGHLTGFALAVLLTLIPFAAVGLKLFSSQTTIAVIVIAAIVQIVVHLRFFLGIRIKPDRPRAMVSLLFAVVLMVIMIGGTLWIMTDLAVRMGH